MPDVGQTEEMLNGRYRIERTLGAGGMATVFEAFDEMLRVQRAIKILNPDMAQREKVRARFLSEARTMAQLRHPNIVTVYDVAVEGDRPFIVMEYMRGGCLMDLVDKAGSGLPPAAACSLTAGMLRGLACAHDRGVVHRDVKPHNVLLDEDGVPKVTDFGIAHVEDQSVHLTKTGMVMGTLAYMPPEQRQSARQVDARSDIYASGATLYVLVTGQEPFDLYASEFHDRLFKGVDERVAAVVKQACKFDMDARFSSSAEMADILDALAAELGGESGVSVAPSVAGTTTGSFNLADLQSPSETVWMDDDDSDVIAVNSGQASRGVDTIAPSATVPPPEYDDTPVPTKKSKAPLAIGALALLLAAGGGWFFTQQGAETPAAPPEAAQTAPVKAEVAKPEPTPAPPPVEEVKEPEPPKEEVKVEEDKPKPKPKKASSSKKSSKPKPEPKKVEEEPPAPVAAAGEGQVIVNSRPWSNVKLGGKKLGRTGWKGKLPAGSHTLTLTTADGRSKRLKVVVRKDGTSMECWDFDADAKCAR